MPYIDFDPSKVNKTTTRFLIYYLEKENSNVDEKDKTPFFNQDKNVSDPEKIIDELDNNNSKLGKEEDRYYSLYVSPSEKELAHISNDYEKLKSYTRNLMNAYAQNFNKGYTGDDLLYYAKIENERSYTYKDEEVKNGFVKKGDLKTGNQMHVHIVVSRKTKSKWYKGERVIDRNGSIVHDDSEFIKRANTAKISPMDTAKGGSHFKIGNRTTSRGFNRTAFKGNGENIFDKMFDYKRKPREKFEYVNLKKNHPDEFLKKFGKQPLLIQEPTADRAQTERQKMRYVLKTIEDKLPPNAEKPVEVFNTIMKEKGVRVQGDNFHFKGSTFKAKEVASQLFKTTKVLFSAYYFGQRFLNEQKKIDKTNKEKDDNRENDKQR